MKLHSHFFQTVNMPESYKIECIFLFYVTAYGVFLHNIWLLLSYLIEKSADLTALNESIKIQVFENVQNHFTRKFVEMAVITQFTTLALSAIEKFKNHHITFIITSRRD